jgi:hypothetical protein
MLCTLLHSHPEILCHHEVFNPNGIFYALGYRNGEIDLGTIDERDRSPIEFLARLWQHPLGFNCVGFKMTRGQDERVLQSVLEDCSIRKIVLRRLDVVRTYVSELIARETGRWEVYDHRDLPSEAPKVHVDADSLHAHLELNHAFYIALESSLARSRQEYFSTCYERLHSRDEHRRLLNFLNVSSAFSDLEPRSVRQNPGCLGQLVANYQELQSVLNGTDLAHFLHPNEVPA